MTDPWDDAGRSQAGFVVTAGGLRVPVAAPTALVVEALISGSRQPLPGLAILDEEFGARGAAGLVLLELGNGRIQRRLLPTLSPQESTETGSAIHKR